MAARRRRGSVRHQLAQAQQSGYEHIDAHKQRDGENGVGIGVAVDAGRGQDAADRQGDGVDDVSRLADPQHATTFFDVDDVDFRVMAPVSVRTTSQRSAMGNHGSAVEKPAWGSEDHCMGVRSGSRP